VVAGLHLDVGATSACSIQVLEAGNGRPTFARKAKDLPVASEQPLQAIEVLWSKR
jgi:hypothetical protein